MSEYLFEQLVDLDQVRQLLDAHHRLSGMAYGLLDITDNCLVSVGWQEICARFHRANPVSSERCRESDAYIKEHLHDFKGEFLEYRCKNGMIDVAVPIIIDGQHLATFFTGQFFYEDARPDSSFFTRQAKDLGFDGEAYLAALQRVPVFSRAHVHDNIRFLLHLVKVLSRCGLNNLKLQQEMEERRRTEQLLHKREQELRTMLENTPDTIARYDGACRRLYANGTLAGLAGVPVATLLGKTPTDYSSSPEALEYETRIKKVFQSERKDEYEFSWTDRQGKPRISLICMVPERDGEGRVASVLCVGRDLSERRRAENNLREQVEFLRQLLEAIPIPVYYKGTDGVYRGCNEAFVTFIGLPREKIVGHTSYEVAPKKLADVYHRADMALLRRPGVQIYESCVMQKGTNRRDVLFHKATYVGTEGRVAGIVGTILDITVRKRAEAALKESQTRLQMVLRTIPDMIWMKNVDGIFLFCNHAVVRLFGKAESEIVGATDYELYDPELADFIRQKDREAIAAGRICINEEWLPSAENGQRILMETRKVPVFGEDGKVVGVLGMARDITERRRTEELLHQREQEFRAMIEHSPDPVVRYDREGRRIYVNPAFEMLMGKPSRLSLGKMPTEMPVGGCPRIGMQAQQAINQVFAKGEPAQIEVSWRDADGSEHCYQIRFVPEFDPNGTVATVLSSARDITPLRAFQRKLQDLAYYDHLTRLPNRVLFLERLHQAVAGASLGVPKAVALMLLDLDRFKTVNDSLGHGIGDELLLQVARRLEQKVGDHGSVARLGGDEFALLLPDISNDTDLESVARKVLATFAEPFHIQDRPLCVTTSIGIAVYPRDCRDATELVQLADAAMYRAKARGRNHFQFCSLELRSCARERLSLEAALRNALAQAEFELYYQPKIELQTGIMVGAEALLRWQHPTWGAMSPDRFIGIAEETGLIFDLGAWVLRQACMRACAWNRSGDSMLKVAVNLSARQFDKNNLVETVRTILADTGCRPEWLELEITESLLLEERHDNLTSLRELRGMGFTVAIDDFGTGYSALGYLTKFPIQTLKIDKSFVRDLPGNRYNAELIKAIVSLGHALGMELVAEGVETREQAIHLEHLGCQFAQGYLFGKPVPVKRFEEMMSTAKMSGQIGYGAALHQMP